MKRIILSSVAVLLGAIAGCGSNPPATNLCMNVTCTAPQICDPTTGMCIGTTDKCAGVTCNAAAGQTCDSNTGMCVNPPVPTNIGAQIDRMGRPGINTALTNPFGFYPKANPEMTDVTKDRYNADTGGMNPAMVWAMNWGAAITQHLAYFDSLDGTCGNQVAYGQLGAAYAGLTQVLAGDALQVDTTQTTCARYLGAEAKALNPMAPADCGGRTLTENVIDVTYSLLATGMPNMVSNGITMSSGTPTAAFPFMAAPM